MSTTPAFPTHNAGREGSRVAHDSYWHDGSTHADPLGIRALDASDLPALLASEDPYDRCRAYVLLDRLRRSVHCPDGTWTVFSTYRDGFGGAGNKALWSAHMNEADARTWHAAWVAKWERNGRNDYDTQVAPMDGVPIHYLRHEGAEPHTG